MFYSVVLPTNANPNVRKMFCSVGANRGQLFDIYQEGMGGGGNNRTNKYQKTLFLNWSQNRETVNREQNDREKRFFLTIEEKTKRNGKGKKLESLFTKNQKVFFPGGRSQSAAGPCTQVFPGPRQT